MASRVTRFRFNNSRLSKAQCLEEIKRADAQMRAVIELCRRAGAHNAANYCARASKSVKGAIRHADRMAFVERLQLGVANV